jgi:hypothetical protein
MWVYSHNGKITNGSLYLTAFHLLCCMDHNFSLATNLNCTKYHWNGNIFFSNKRMPENA